MTTPTGQISMANVRNEIYGSTSISINIDNVNVRWLAGASSGQVTMNQLKGKTFTAPFWTPTNQYVNVSGTPNASTTLSASGRTVTWFWTVQSGTTPSMSIANGGQGTSMGMLLNGGVNGRTASVDVTAVSGKYSFTWSVFMTAEGSGGVTVTL